MKVLGWGFTYSKASLIKKEAPPGGGGRGEGAGRSPPGTRMLTQQEKTDLAIRQDRGPAGRRRGGGIGVGERHTMGSLPLQIFCIPFEVNASEAGPFPRPRPPHPRGEGKGPAKQPPRSRIAAVSPDPRTPLSTHHRLSLEVGF